MGFPDLYSELQYVIYKTIKLLAENGTEKFKSAPVDLSTSSTHNMFYLQEHV